MDRIHLTLTKKNYNYIRDSHFNSKYPLKHPAILAYLNASRGLKGEVVSFSVEETDIYYKKK